MAKLRPQQLAWGFFGVTVLGISALFFIEPTGDGLNQKGSPAPLADGATLAAPAIVNDAPVMLPEKRYKIISTPREHDQLVISSNLEGTNIDGALKADIDGNLILDLEVRDFFDYFLSIADDIGAELAIAEIQRYAQTYLPEPATSQVLELLDNYLRYKQGEFELQQTPITQATLADGDALQLLRTSFDKLREQRQALFSLEQDSALFGLEDSYANYTLSSLALMADETTSDEQKRASLMTLESELPSALSASITQTRVDRERQLVIESVLTSPQDDTQVYERLNQQGLDQRQIDSVIERRQQQRLFDSEYQRYQQAKLGLNLKPGSERYAIQLQELQNRFFVSQEAQTQAKLRDLAQD